MPKIPPSIAVGPHVYSVTADSSGLVGDHGDNRGSTVNELLTIAVDVRNPRTIQQETLLHEALHACWDQTALTAHDCDDHQELIVTALAPVVFDMLRRNPELVAFLTK